MSSEFVRIGFLTRSGIFLSANALQFKEKKRELEKRRELKKKILVSFIAQMQCIVPQRIQVPFLLDVAAPTTFLLL